MKLRDLEKELRDAEARLVDKLLNANVDDSIVPDPAVLWQVCGGHAWYQGQVRVIDHAQQRPVAAKVEFRVDTDGTLDALVNNDVKLQGFVAGAHHGTKNVQTFPQQIPFSYLIGSIEEGGFNFVDINGREVGDVVPLRMVHEGDSVAARNTGEAEPSPTETSVASSGSPKKLVEYQSLEHVEGEEGVYRLPHTQFVTQTELTTSGLSPKQADNTMQRAGPKKGFLEYKASARRSPRYVVVPYRQEKLLHAKLLELDVRAYDAGTFWVDVDMVDTYLGGDAEKVRDALLPTIEHYGRTLVPKKYLDELVSGAERTKHRKKAKRAKEKKDTATAVPHPNAPPKRLQPTGTLVDVLHYFAHDAQGTMKQAEDGTRFYVALDGERWAPMVAEGDRITYGEVFKVFTPDDLHMKKRSDYQNGMRHAVMGTTAFTAKVTKDGEVPERTGRGIKLFLDGKYVNAARVYIIDKTDRTALSDMPTGVAI
jgi:hypothetical protein